MWECLFDGVKGGIHRAITRCHNSFFFIANADHQIRILGGFGAADDTQEFQLQMVGGINGTCICHQGDDIVVKHLFLAICQCFEAHEYIVELIIGQFKAQILELRAQGRATRVLAQWQRCPREADILGAHDLKRIG